jgi:hypothetical protein
LDQPGGTEAFIAILTYIAPGDQVQAWTARAVTVETLDQVFG